MALFPWPRPLSRLRADWAARSQTLSFGARLEISESPPYCQWQWVSLVKPVYYEGSKILALPSLSSSQIHTKNLDFLWPHSFFLLSGKGGDIFITWKNGEDRHLFMALGPIFFLVSPLLIKQCWDNKLIQFIAFIEGKNVLGIGGKYLI